jgi:hypothetical protein
MLYHLGVSSFAKNSTITPELMPILPKYRDNSKKGFLKAFFRIGEMILVIFTKPLLLNLHPRKSE